jgi:exodeoxyribonuclease VII small subunit
MPTSKSSRYQVLAEELELILEELRSGSLDLESAAVQYKKGILIADEMAKLLTETENIVRKIGSADKNKK